MSPAHVLSLASGAQPTLLFATPRFLVALLELFPPRSALASVRCTVTAGEPLPAGLFERYRHRFGHGALDGICSAETLHVFVSSGTPVPGWEIQLADRGRMNIRGPWVVDGYWRGGTVDPVAITKGFMASGDVCRRTQDGSLVFLGRSDDMISAGSVQVGPAEIESVLAEHPDVLEAAVVADRDSAGTESPAAFVVPRAGHRIDADAIAQHCRSRLPAAACPCRIEVVRELPWTAGGSLRRPALRQLLAAWPAEAESLTGQEGFPTGPHPGVAARATDG